MKILKAGTHGHYDVFQGDGWKNHTRIQTIKKKADDGQIEVCLKFVSGRHLSPSAVKQVATLIIPQGVK